jgi:hypothetical protein
MRAGITLFFGLFFITASALAQGESAKPPIETHLASSQTSYKVSLVSSVNNVFASADGVMTDHSERTCEGFKIEQRMIVQVTPANGGPPVVIRSGGDSFESANGLRYTFVTKTSMNGRMIDDSKGEAMLDEIGASGLATIEGAKPVPIPPGVVFPITFARNMLAAAGAGKGSYQARVFDGSSEDGTGMKQVSAVIGAARPVANAQAKISTKPGTVSWPVQISYYGLSEAETVPMMQNGFSLLPNGWTEAMVMDFQQFKLRFDLTEYKPIPEPTCP